MKAVVQQEVIKERQVISRQAIQSLVRECSQLRPWRATGAILRQWLVVVGCFTLPIYFDHWSVYVLSFFIIATRQQALGILMHDATHWRLYETRWLNETISDFFCAFPLGVSTEGYRYEHLLHHRHTNTAQDPYWVLFQEEPLWIWPKTKGQAIKVFLGDLTGLNLRKNAQVQSRWSPYRTLAHPGRYPTVGRWEKIRLGIFYAVVLALLYFFHLWIPFLLLWILPLLTLTQLLIRIRAIAEHHGLPIDHELNDTRHIDGAWWERLTVAPLNINFHIAHHLSPSIPYYHLPWFHREMLAREPYASRARCLTNYLSFSDGVFAELIGSGVGGVAGGEVRMVGRDREQRGECHDA